MATLTIELPPQEAQTACNQRRWDELLADRELAKVEGRIETDRHGHIIMSPPPGRTFKARGTTDALSRSRVCPAFPNRVELR